MHALVWLGQRGAAASGYQVVEVGAATRCCLSLVEAGKVTPVATFGGGRAHVGKALGRIVLHDSQQVEPVVGALTHQGLGDQALQRIGHPGGGREGQQIDDRLGAVQTEATIEHRQLRQGRLLDRGEQIPGPIQGGTHRRLAVVPAAASGQQFEPLVHARQHGVWRNHQHARSRQFDGQRQVVEQVHQRWHGSQIAGIGSVGVVGCQCARFKQLLRLALVHGRQRQGLLAGNAQHFAAGDQETCLRRKRQPKPQACFGLASHLLEVVEDQQAVSAPGDRLANSCQWVGRARRQAQAECGGLHDAVQATRGGQVAEPGAARVVSEPTAGIAQRHAGFANAADAQQCDQAGSAVKLCGQQGQCFAAPDEAVPLGRQVVGQIVQGQPLAVLGIDPVSLGCRDRPLRDGIAGMRLEQLHGV